MTYYDDKNKRYEDERNKKAPAANQPEPGMTGQEQTGVSIDELYDLDPDVFGHLR